MIRIEYTEDKLIGEPGPNVYYMGTPEDFGLLRDTISRLIAVENTHIDLGELDFIEIQPPIANVYLIHQSNGTELASLKGNEITTQLPAKLWKQILEIADTLSMEKCHAFIEFDDLPLTEDVNLIWSSEW